ncbi:hypothetical protein [Spirosoma luteum]|uniref:hypothetical protein n=1 Tax=Spirosoma luteum TaxID=431553 RepID=UPI00035FB307|nr:hypothetical protein [Spirosoma luteum]
MKKRLDYTLIAEGYAEYAFVPTYLKLVADQSGIQAVRSKLGFKGRDAGKSKVLQEADPISTVAILQNHQLIIVGIDLDGADHEVEQPRHTAECQTIVAALGKNYKIYPDRFVYFVTVQAIEQWLAYQAHKVGLAQKFPVNSLESKQQSELKKILYGQKDNGFTMDRVAENIASSADFEELSRQSRSFKHFHHQVVEFLTQYNKTTEP